MAYRKIPYRRKTARDSFEPDGYRVHSLRLLHS